MDNRELWEKFTLYSDEKAFEMLYNRYSQKVLMSCFSHLKNRESAKDIRQDTFEWLWKERENLAKLRIKCFPSWLATVAKNRCRNLITTTNKRAEIQRNMIIGNSCKIELNYDRNIILDCIEKITRIDHRTLLYYKIEGFDNKSITQMMEQDDPWVRRHVHKARKELKRLLGENGLL